MIIAGTVEGWVTALGWPDRALGACLVEAYLAEHGGRFPETTADFCAWANATGRRRPDGSWRCQPASSPGPGQVPGGGPGATELAARARAWVYAHPLEAAGLGALAYLALGMHRAPGRRR